MIIISSTSTDPYFNIAAEEYLLRNVDSDVFMLYINEPSIIVGKHQNAFAELNLRFVYEHGLKVVRRLSGGGTVFHDLGNLNFCFIQKGEEGNLIDFKRFTQPIVDVLVSLGVPAVHSGRNDLLINGLKFSGNAEHVYRSRTLHHGTILFNSKLDNLREGLKVKAENFNDKAVKSVRSKVTNIAEHLPTPLTITELKDAIIQHVSSINSNSSFYTFSESDLAQIEFLIGEKYSRWDWNFGYSPRFGFKNEVSHKDEHWTAELEVEKGKITRAKILCNENIISDLQATIEGKLYDIQSIAEILKLSSYHSKIDELLKLLF